MNSHYEPFLRMAICNIQNARDYVDRLPGDGLHMDFALSSMQAAINELYHYAAENDISLRMPT